MLNAKAPMCEEWRHSKEDAKGSVNVILITYHPPIVFFKAKFDGFWVITFEPDKIQKRTIPQNKHLNVINLEFPCNFFLKWLDVG